MGTKTKMLTIIASKANHRQHSDEGIEKVVCNQTVCSKDFSFC